MPNDFWLLLIANLPITAVVLLALHRGWIVMGRTYDRERAEWKASFEREYAEKKEAQDRLAEATAAMAASAEVMERAVTLAERR